MAFKSVPSRQELLKELLRFVHGNVFNKICYGGATYRVSSGSCNHSRDSIAPDGNNLDDRASAFPKEDSRADIKSQSAEKFPKRPRSDRFSRSIDDQTDHKRLQRGQDRHIGEGNGLEANDSAYSGEGFQQ